MGGRWTIWVFPNGDLMDMEPAPRGNARQIPVVPCNTAAIERATDHVFANYTLRVGMARQAPMTREQVRSMLMDAWQAAGETP